jgi:hypothetical protein
MWALRLDGIPSHGIISLHTPQMSAGTFSPRNPVHKLFVWENQANPRDGGRENKSATEVQGGAGLTTGIAEKWGCQ